MGLNYIKNYLNFYKILYLYYFSDKYYCITKLNTHYGVKGNTHRTNSDSN